MYMVCDLSVREEATSIFRQMAESFEKSPDLRQYDEQIAEQDIMISNMAFQQNQQMINYAMDQQNAAWDAVERQRDMLSRDLDSFRSGLNQSMQQNDAWRSSMGSSTYGLPA